MQDSINWNPQTITADRRYPRLCNIREPVRIIYSFVIAYNEQVFPVKK